MMISYEIIPKKGLGNLTFGMDMEKVISALGEPEEVDNFEGDEELDAVLLHYQDKGFSVFFEGLTRQVVAGIETNYSDALLFGEKVIGMKEEQVVDLMTRNGIPDYDKETEEGETRLSFEEVMVDFYFRDDKVAFVNWDVIVDEEGNITEF